MPAYVTNYFLITSKAMPDVMIVMSIQFTPSEYIRPSAAAFVNATQLLNGYGYLGGYMNEGLKRSYRLSKEDRAILEMCGTEDEVGLEQVSALDETRLEATRFGKAWDRWRKVQDVAMKAFTTVEKMLRKSATLGAYYKAVLTKSPRCAL